MDLPIDDSELKIIIDLLRLDNQHELAERLVMVRKLQKEGKPYKSMFREMGWVI